MGVECVEASPLEGGENRPDVLTLAQRVAGQTGIGNQGGVTRRRERAANLVHQIQIVGLGGLRQRGVAVVDDRRGQRS